MKDGLSVRRIAELEWAGEVSQVREKDLDQGRARFLKVGARIWSRR